MNSRRNINWGGDNNALVFLIAANLVIFLFMKIMFFILHNRQGEVMEDYYRVLSQFAQPGKFSEFITRPWTLITAPFSHESLRLLFSNMLWLFSFGYLIQQLGQNRHLLPVYLYGSLVAGLTYLLTVGLMPQLSGGTAAGYLAGAAPAVLAVAVATVSLQPGYRIFPFINNGIPIWVLLAIFLVIDMSLLAYSRTEMLPAHIMAGVTGFFYTQAVKKGKDPAAWMRRLYSLFTGKNNPGPSGRQQLFYTDQSVSPYERKKKVTQAVIDEILDKINRKGYDSLTAEEKEILKKAKDEL